MIKLKINVNYYGIQFFYKFEQINLFNYNSICICLHINLINYMHLLLLLVIKEIIFINIRCSKNL